MKHPLFRLTKNVGSPRYMSPEIALGEYYNELTDVYALGLLSYEILSLKRPYDRVVDCINRDCNGNYRNNGNADIVVVDDYTTTTTTTTRGVESSMKLKSINRRRSLRSRSRSRSRRNRNNEQDNNKNNSKSNSNRKNKINDEHKYLNIRPLLPILTLYEELKLRRGQHQQQQQQDVTAAVDDAAAAAAVSSVPTKQFNNNVKRNSSIKKLSSFLTINNNNNKNTPTKNNTKITNTNTNTSSSSLYWTKSLRCIILKSWDRNIQNRPTAIEIQKQFQVEYDKLTSVLT
jgi:hypothetical protein